MAYDLNLPLDILLVRHGQSEANVVGELFLGGDRSGQEALLAARRHDGHVRLTDLGRTQAKAVGQWVREEVGPLDRYFSSQYIRTRETAAEMDLPKAQWTLDLMIRERDQGVNDSRGTAGAYTDEEWTEKERRERSKMYWSPAAGESVADVCVRVRQFLNMLQVVASGMRVIVVCHHQVINAFRILLEDRAQWEFESVLDEPMPNCCIFWYSRRDAEGVVQSQLCTAKKITVGLEGKETQIEEFPIQRRSYTNADLLDQVQYLPQLVNNDGVVTERPTTSAGLRSKL